MTPRAHSRASRRQLVWLVPLAGAGTAYGLKELKGARNNRNREQEDQPDSQRAARQGLLRVNGWDTPQIHLLQITQRELPGLERPLLPEAEGAYGAGHQRQVAAGQLGRVDENNVQRPAFCPAGYGKPQCPHMG